MCYFVFVPFCSILYFFIARAGKLVAFLEDLGVTGCHVVPSSVWAILPYRIGRIEMEGREAERTYFLQR